MVRKLAFEREVGSDDRLSKDTVDLSPADGQGPIRACVARELAAYLSRLEGDDAVDLYRLVMDQVEPALFDAVLDYCAGNQTRAAAMLGINRATLRKKMQRHGPNQREA